MRVAGFNELEIMRSLRGKKNLAPLFKGLKANASDEEMSKEVKKVLGSGKIGATSFLNAVIASSENKRNKNIGDIASEFGEKSLTGTISNFKSSFEDLLGSVNVQDWEGIKQFQAFLTRITKMMQGDVGKGLLGTVEKLINSILGGLSKIEDSDIKGFVETIAKIGEKAVEVVKEAWSWIDKLVHAEPGEFLDNVKGILVDAGKLIGEGILAGVKGAAVGAGKDALGIGGTDYVGKYGFSKDTLSGLAAKRGMDLKTFLPQFAAARTDYIAQGKDMGIGAWLRGGTVGKAEEIASMMQGVGKDAAQGMEVGAREELDSHSPSRTMARVGEDAAKGLVMGTEKGVAAAPGGRGIRDVYVDVKVGAISGMGDPTEAANTIADVTVERVVLALLERKALEG
jgi:hypothetical protein